MILTNVWFQTNFDFEIKLILNYNFDNWLKFCETSKSRHIKLYENAFHGSQNIVFLFKSLAKQNCLFLQFF